jgi:hypothetical protein
MVGVAVLDCRIFLYIAVCMYIHCVYVSVEALV